MDEHKSAKGREEMPYASLNAMCGVYGQALKFTTMIMFWVVQHTVYF